MKTHHEIYSHKLSLVGCLNSGCEHRGKEQVGKSNSGRSRARSVPDLVPAQAWPKLGPMKTIKILQFLNISAMKSQFYTGFSTFIWRNHTFTQVFQHSCSDISILHRFFNISVTQSNFYTGFSIFLQRNLFPQA